MKICCTWCIIIVIISIVQVVVVIAVLQQQRVAGLHGGHEAGREGGHHQEPHHPGLWRHQEPRHLWLGTQTCNSFNCERMSVITQSCLIRAPELHQLGWMDCVASKMVINKTNWNRYDEDLYCPYMDHTQLYKNIPALTAASNTEDTVKHHSE